MPIELPDRGTLERALLSPGSAAAAIAHAGEPAVRRAVMEGAEPFRRPDGSYRIENRFRYLVAIA